jgi:hypothetical protein
MHSKAETLQFFDKVGQVTVDGLGEEADVRRLDLISFLPHRSQQ